MGYGAYLHAIANVGSTVGLGMEVVTMVVDL